MAVGLAATLYHASSGAARRWARKLDYWTIAYTSSAMVGGPGAEPAALWPAGSRRAGGCTGVQVGWSGGV